MPYFIIIAVASAIFRKQRLSSLLVIRFRYPMFILFPLVVQLCIIFLCKHRTPAISLIYVFTFLCIIVGLLMNHRIKGIKLILFGACLNLVAVVANHGVMPIYAGTVQFAHWYSTAQPAAQVVTRHAWDWWLVDWIPVPLYFMSPGDILIGIGVVQFVLLNTNRR